MKVALPEWNGRVSPVFDTAGRLVVVRIEDGVEVERESIAIDEELPGPKAAWLSRIGVATLICGAVSNGLARAIEAVGIALIPWTAGCIDEVIAAYLGGRLDVPAFRMPGCRGARMRRGRQCRGGRGYDNDEGSGSR
ncbi:MAG: NifB/NifX family molybdenum-iron cluster-binding protein [Candidatus Krumholzibacteria bacterium]|nr:NifB/NifX family molybdenum-iron cluster-binding protein [Candidatus Krumholzibacteria bacterium]